MVFVFCCKNMDDWKRCNDKELLNGLKSAGPGECDSACQRMEARRSTRFCVGLKHVLKMEVLKKRYPGFV